MTNFIIHYLLSSYIILASHFIYVICYVASFTLRCGIPIPTSLDSSSVHVISTHFSTHQLYHSHTFIFCSSVERCIFQNLLTSCVININFLLNLLYEKYLKVDQSIHRIRSALHLYWESVFSRLLLYKVLTIYNVNT